MTIRYKHTSGGWVTLAAGDIRLKNGHIGGGSWLGPAFIRLNYSAIGSGSWIDSGYRGYPATPTSLAVNAWTYTSASVKWAAGAGGAPVTNYEVQLQNQSGGVIQTVVDTASPSVTFPLAVSTRYQVYVRAKGASGLYSPWVGPLRIQTGKPAETYETTETGTRAWSKAAAVNGYKDAAVGPVVPTSVRVTAIRYQIQSNAGFTSALSPYNNREIRPWLLSGDNYAVFQWLAQAVDVTVSHNFNSNGGVQGMICRGAGWSIFTDGVQRAVGTITVTGVETYQYQQSHTIPAVANSYW